MSSSNLKIIAAITMTLSHLNSLLFPQFWWMYLIGRLAFPLFAWSVAQGAVHTHNIRLYLIRLLALALISQIPYVMAHQLTDPTFNKPNVVFTLFAGLLAIWSIRSSRNLIYKIAAVGTIAYLAEILVFDYGAEGVLSVASFYIFRNELKYLILAQIALIISMLAIPGYEIWLSGEFHIENMLYFGNIFALLALPLVALYNNRRGLNLKYFFYAYYPLHLAALYFLGLWVL